MYVVIVARASRMQVINCMRKALSTRGYVDADKPEAKNASRLSFDVFDSGDRVGCSFFVSGLHEQALAALADIGAEATAARLEIIGQHVTWAERITLSAEGEIDVDSCEEEAEEILEDWADGGYVDSSAESGLAFALLDITDHMPQHEHLEFWRDPTRPLPEAEPPPPPPWRSFAHKDGRRWRIRVHADRYDVEITDTDGDTIARTRESKHADTDARVLIFDQQADGFLETD